MSYLLNGFVKIKPKINNAVGIISPVGELSTFSQTFTKELAEFEDTQWPDVVFVSMKSLGPAGPIPVQRAYADHVLAMAQQVFEFCDNFVGQLTILDVANNLMASYQGQISNLTVGSLVTGSGITVPEWISWSNINLPTNNIKIWFSDPALRRQYSDYSIVVVPPIDNIDDFFATTAQVKAALAGRTASRTAELVQEAKNGHPETVYRVDDFEFASITTPEYKPKVSWSTLIYGSAGDNNDLVKAAIRDYCLANSSRPLTDWAVIFPDIFKTTEFLVVPFWNKIAIPNKTSQVGMFSPVIGPAEALTQVKSLYDAGLGTHIETHLQILGHNYRSVTLGIFGGLANKNNKFKITDYYPDYINVGTNSPDFNRMEKTTQDWSYMLSQLLVIAENPDSYPDLPANMKKMTRAGVNYITRTIDNILYMVVTKASVTP